MLEGLKDRIFPLEIHGVKLSIIFDTNAMAELEPLIESGIEELLNAEQVGFSLARLLLWAGTRSYHETLTIHDIGRLFMPSDLDDVMRVVDEALQAAFENQREKKEIAVSPEEINPTGR